MGTVAATATPTPGATGLGGTTANLPLVCRIGNSPWSTLPHSSQQASAPMGSCTIRADGLAVALLATANADTQKTGSAWLAQGVEGTIRHRTRIVPRPRGTRMHRPLTGNRALGVRRPSRLTIGQQVRRGGARVSHPHTHGNTQPHAHRHRHGQRGDTRPGTHAGSRGATPGSKSEGADHSNKESMHSRGAEEFVKDHKKADVDRDIRPPLPPGANTAGMIALSNDPDRPVVPPARHPPAELAPMAPLPAEPACLHFHDAGETLRQVRKSARELIPLSYCVHPGAIHVFEHILRVRREDPAGHVEPVLAHVVRQSIPEVLQQAQIRKYSGFGQLLAQEARASVPLGHEVLYAVKTISRLPHRLQGMQAHGIASNQQLPYDSFKLLEHRGPGGERSLLVAWCVASEADDGTGHLHAGMADIVHSGGLYSVTEPSAGMKVSTYTLPDLISGIEQLSGCRFVPDTATAWDRDNDEDVPLLQASQVFVIDPVPPGGETAAAPVMPLLGDDGREFLKLYPYTVPSRVGTLSGALFRTTFSVLPDSIVYVDASGQRGSLLMVKHAGDAGRQVTLQTDAKGLRFMQALGLQAGKRYRQEDLVQLLVEQGFTGIAAGEGQSEPELEPEMVIDADRGLLPSTFRFHGLELHYRDHGGQPGTLLFTAADDPVHTLSVSDDNSLDALLFAHDQDISNSAQYSQDTLTWLLQGHGYVLYPRMDAKARQPPLD